MTLGEQIALQRRQKGITQEGLSEQSGISLRTIQRIENDQSIPRAYTLMKLTAFLELDADALLKTHHATAMASGPNFIRLAQKMNLAGLTVVLFPVLPLIIVLTIWIKNKEDETLSLTGKRIISFQIFWLILTLLVLAFTKIAYYYVTGAHSVGHLSPLLPVYLFMLAFNLALIVYSTFRLQKQELGIYHYIPSLF